MTDIFKACLKILPPEQRRLWPQLKPAYSLGFTLYGGTAVALRLDHRPSVDFDFFSEKPLDRDAILEAFPFMRQSTIIQNTSNSFSVLVPDRNSPHQQVKLSFFCTIDFGRVGQPDVTDDDVMCVASIEDLMATKMTVIQQRIEVKDYQDIAAMINAGASLSHGLGAARALHGLNFQPSESLKALVYFKGGDLHLLTKKEKNILVNAVSKVRNIPNVPIISKSLTP